MKIALALATAILIAITMSGCGSAVPTVAKMIHHEGNAIVYIHRDDDIMGMLAKPTVTVDDVVKGEIPISSHFVLDLPAKKTKFKLSAEIDQSFHIDLQANKEYLIDITPVVGLFTPNVSWDLIENPEIIKHMISSTENINNRQID